ncbi:uncharacterized protein P884DRAFT_317179 [Thermothelomyces heterothallicus CBS 202.75]|uniref:uncharacterized protein n=1 Tax=Thermothelomyces heterothallicus CBS 202.75 TaxID=1149848 RepID=UPI003742FFC1
MATPPSNYPSTLGTRKLPRDVQPVSIADADYLAWAVDAPASESGPLFRLMFPCPGVDFSEQQKDEIIRWYAEGIKDAIISGRTYLRKIRHGDGTVVGLAGWISNEKRSEDWLPRALDVSAWLNMSAALKKERYRAIGHLDNVCRITIMSIRPEYQRQGLGSILMQHICEDMDRHARYGYVLASPARVRLYSKFGFEAVGKYPYSRHGHYGLKDGRRIGGQTHNKAHAAAEKAIDKGDSSIPGHRVAS